MAPSDYQKHRGGEFSEMKHGSVFTGIGGFDLAAEWMGWENVFHCEIEKDKREHLNKKWPLAESYGDISQYEHQT